MLPDYHMHTWRCGHAIGEMEEYVRAARFLGLEEIGFTDHFSMYWLPEAQRDRTLAMAEDEMVTYIREVKSLREKTPDLVIRLGIEADYIAGKEKDLRDLLLPFEFDYIIGSVHYLNGWAFDDPAQLDEYPKRDIDEIYREYFHLLQDAARSGLFDIMAHPDLVKKFGYRCKTDPRPWYEETARTFSQGGVCVEVNTAGLRWPANEIYPSLDFLKACCKYNVPATMGSDAHSPEQVGYGRNKACALLVEAGYREVATFQNRKCTLVPL